MLQRHVERELMDDPELDAGEHVRALRGLARINRWSRVHQALWPVLCDQSARVSGAPLRVLDVACGGGDVAAALAKRAAREGMAMEFVGCDISARALAHAARLAARLNARVSFFQCDVLQNRLPDEYDVLMCSLFLHHLDTESQRGFVQELASRAKRMVVVLDLERRRSGLALAHAATRVLSRSRVVHVDGPRSVRAALTVAEMTLLAQGAGMQGVHVRRCWPMRILMTWRRPT